MVFLVWITVSGLFTAYGQIDRSQSSEISDLVSNNVAADPINTNTDIHTSVDIQSPGQNSQIDVTTVDKEQQKSTEATITCTARGRLIEAVGWIKPDGTSLPSDQNDENYKVNTITNVQQEEQITTLTVGSDQNSRDAVYSCKVKYKNEQGDGGVAHISKPVHLKIFTVEPTTHVKSVTTAVAQTLGCTIKDVDPDGADLIVTWKDPDDVAVSSKDTTNYALSQERADSGRTQLSVLTIKEPKMNKYLSRQSITYKCSVKSSQYAASPPSADVLVTANIINIVVVPGNVEQLVSTVATVACTVSGLTKQLDDVQWSDGAIIKSGSNGYTISKGKFLRGFQKTTLTVAGPQNKRDTTYKCLITSREHGAKNDPHTVNLKVFSIRPEPELKIVTTSADQTLTCVIEGLDTGHPVSVTWKDPKGALVNTGDTTNYVFTSKNAVVNENGIQSATLTIKKAKLASLESLGSFAYTCSARSTRYGGSPTSPDIRIPAEFRTADSDCPEGHLQLEGTCKPCSPGTFLNSAATPLVCSECPYDTYSYAAAKACSKCPDGLGTLQTGSKFLEKCTAVCTIPQVHFTDSVVPASRVAEGGLVKIVCSDGFKYGDSGQAKIICSKSQNKFPASCRKVEVISTTPKVEVSRTVIVTCRVVAKSFGVLNIKWFKEGAKSELVHDGKKLVISAAEKDDSTDTLTSRLTISNFGLGDEVGSYFCRVNYDVLLDDSSQPISLDLLGPIYFVFTSQPNSQIINRGKKSVDLTCEAITNLRDYTGYSITYSWFRYAASFSTPPNDKSDLIRGQTGKKLTVSVNDIESGGKNKFQCRAATGNHVILSNVATLMVESGTATLNPIPSFKFPDRPPVYRWLDTSDPEESQSNEGPFVKYCEGPVSVGDQVFQRAIYRNSKIFTSSDLPKVVGPEFSGVYQCVIWNKPDKSLWFQKTTYVVVAANPTATIKPPFLDLQSGSPVKFTCVVGGNPIHSVIITGPNSFTLDCLAQTSTNEASCSLSSKDGNLFTYIVTIYTSTSGSVNEESYKYKCTVKTRLQKFTQGLGGRKTSLKAVERESVGIININVDRCGYIQHSGGDCIHPFLGSSEAPAGTKVVIHPACKEERLYYCVTSQGEIRHMTSGRCIQPSSGSNSPSNNELLVLNNCGSSATKFKFTQGGSIQHVASGKCWYPNGGIASPPPNTEVVLHDGCNEDKLRFTFNYVDISQGRSCGTDEFQCREKRTCIPKYRVCDGPKHCADGSDEGTCPDKKKTEELKCMSGSSLFTIDDSAKISCPKVTECSYSCVNQATKFHLKTSGGVELVSKMEVTCDLKTSQWSHMTDDNPLGNFPSCRGIGHTNPVIEWTSSFSPSNSNNQYPIPGPEMRSIGESNKNTGCPSISRITVSLHQALLFELGKGLNCDTDNPPAAKRRTQERDKKCDLLKLMTVGDVKCLALENGSLKITSVVEFHGSPGSSGNSASVQLNTVKEMTEKLSTALGENDFHLTIDRNTFKDNNDQSIQVKEICQSGLLKLQLSDGQSVCMPCDRGEFYNSKSNTCDPCPLNEFNDEVGKTSCVSCPYGKVTPRVGSRRKNDCISPSEVCVVKGESNGRRSPRYQTSVTADSLIQTFCQDGYSLAWDGIPSRTCAFINRTPNRCHEVCKIAIPDAKAVIFYQGTVEVYGKEFLKYKESVKYKCSEKTDTVTCGVPGEKLTLTGCEDRAKITYCSEVKEESKVYGNYNWPVTKPSSNAKLPCYYNNESFARKFCSATGFKGTDFSSCSSAVANKIKDIAKEAKVVTDDTQDSISDKIQSTTADSGQVMSSTDVQNTAQIIDDIIDTPKLKISDTTLNNLVTTVDNVQTNIEVDELRKGGTSDMIRDSAVKIVGEFASQKTKTFKPLNSVGFAVAAVSKNDSNKAENKNVLVLAGDTNIIKGSTNEDHSSQIFFKAEIMTAENQIATAVYYETDKSFPSNTVPVGSSANEAFKTIAEKLSKDLEVEETAQGLKSENEVSLVASIISDINIVATNDTQKIVTGDFSKQKVNMRFTVKDETELKVHNYTKRKTLVSTKLTCKFYDTSARTRYWSDKGCLTNSHYDRENKETHVTCSCDHLTSFAVLMSFSSEENYLEELVSHILLAISLFCLLLTLAAILPNKKSLKMKSTQVNLMLILALIISIVCFFLMDFFVVAEEDAKPSVPCSVVAFLLNYFWLCQLSWMIIEAVTMYIALVQVFGPYIRRAMLKYSLAGWGVPLIFPLIGLAWGGTDYADPKTCFIKYPYGLATFYGPVVLGVAANWILFVFIARVIVKASKTKAEKTGETNFKMRTKQLQSALAVSTLLGLSWIIGFFLLMNNSNYGKISLVFRWLFIALNAPQGFFIFLFYVLLKEDTRKFWAKKLKSKKKSPATSNNGGTSNDKGHKSEGISSNVVSNQRPSTTSTATFTTQLSNSPLITNSRVIENRAARNSAVAAPLAAVSEVPMSEFNSLENEQSSKNSGIIGDDERVYCSVDELDIVHESVPSEINPTSEDAITISSPSYRHDPSVENVDPEIAPLEDNIYSDEQIAVNVYIDHEQPCLNNLPQTFPPPIESENLSGSDSERGSRRVSSESDSLYSDLPVIAINSVPQIPQKRRSKFEGEAIELGPISPHVSIKPEARFEDDEIESGDSSDKIINKHGNFCKFVIHEEKDDEIDTKLDIRYNSTTELDGIGEPHSEIDC